MKDQTLPLRMERHCDNAIAVANYLQDHPASTTHRHCPGKNSSLLALRRI